MPRYTVLLLPTGLLAAALFSAQAAVSPECISETEALQVDSFLDVIQNDLYKVFQDDYNRLCDFSSITNPDCGLEFDGNNRTYVLACEDKGGQVMTRPVKLKCGYSIATVDMGLGEIPQCIGMSCDAANVTVDELKDSRVEEFLNNLSFTGCDAQTSGATRSYLGVLGLVASLAIVGSTLNIL